MYLTAKEKSQRRQSPVLCLEPLQQRNYRNDVHEGVEEVHVYERVRVGAVHC